MYCSWILDFLVHKGFRFNPWKRRILRSKLFIQNFIQNLNCETLLSRLFTKTLKVGNVWGKNRLLLFLHYFVTCHRLLFNLQATLNQNGQPHAEISPFTRTNLSKTEWWKLIQVKRGWEIMEIFDQWEKLSLASCSKYPNNFAEEQYKSSSCSREWTNGCIQKRVLLRGATGAARAPKPGETPIMAARRRCRRHLLFFKIEVRPRSCRSYHIWRPCESLKELGLLLSVSILQIRPSIFKEIFRRFLAHFLIL